jgi:predicted neutral ceramidase superfamily lipid hydrolase
MFTLLDQENWRYSIDTGWQEWDIQIYGNFWWSIILRTVTEYHGGGKCLTRVQLRYRYVTTTVIVNLIVLTLFIYHFLKTGHVQLFFAIPYAFFALFLFLRARRLKTRVRELVDFAAYRINMTRILRSHLRRNPTAGGPK